MSISNSDNFRRKNRKIKFDEDKYIEKYYMRGDKAVIPVKLDKAEDLYMEHDYKQMELSDSVCAYIEEIAYMIPIDIDIIIEIHCPSVDISTQERMKKAIKNNYGMEIDDVEYDVSVQNKRSFVMLISGLLLLVINIVFEKYIGSIISNFLSVVWWVAIWDLVEIQTMDKADNKAKRLSYQQLYDAEVLFIFDEIL